LAADSASPAVRLDVRLCLGGLAWAALGVPAAFALYLTVHSLGWPLVHDAPLMHYIASRILDGAVPYRDLFDMNFPGIYLVHIVGLGLFGRSDAGFRALDLLALAATVAGLGAALRGFGARAVFAAGALFWLYHVAGGAWRAGQRDLLLCLPLAWAAAAAVADAAHPRVWTLGCAAAAVGAAVWIKPYAAVWIPVIAALAWRRPPPARPAALAAALLGLGLAGLTIVGWLAAAGALPAFVDMLVGYIPLYVALGREPLLAAIRGHDQGWLVLAGLALWAAAGAAALWRGGARDGRLAVLAAGVLGGVLHFVLQGRGWEYHLYPLALFTIALGAAGLPGALDGVRVAPALLLAVALGAVTGGLAVKGTRNLAPDWIAAKHARARAVAEALAPVVASGQTVQVLDTTDGGIEALYRLGARQPTRFLYDFHFYHDVDRPYVRDLRAELLTGLQAWPPGAVALFEHGWPRGGYERLREFPELAAWLECGYRLAVEGDGFRVYTARSDSASCGAGRRGPAGPIRAAALPPQPRGGIGGVFRDPPEE
jgi:hypothetical protein